MNLDILKNETRGHIHVSNPVKTCQVRLFNHCPPSPHRWHHCQETYVSSEGPFYKNQCNLWGFSLLPFKSQGTVIKNEVCVLCVCVWDCCFCTGPLQSPLVKWLVKGHSSHQEPRWIKTASLEGEGWGEGGGDSKCLPEASLTTWVGLRDSPSK